MNSKIKIKPVMKRSIVDFDKCLDSVRTLKRVIESKYDCDSHSVRITLTVKTKLRFVRLNGITKTRIPFVHYIRLPYHWRHETNSLFNACVILKHSTNTDAFKSWFWGNGITSIGKVFSARKPIKTKPNREPIKQKEKFCREFDRFLADREFSANPRFLRSNLWIKNEKLPSFIDLNDCHLIDSINDKLDETWVYCFGKESKASVNIGMLSQSSRHIARNLFVVIKVLSNRFSKQIESLELNSKDIEDDSVSIQLYKCDQNKWIVENKLKPRSSDVNKTESNHSNQSELIVISDDECDDQSVIVIE